MKTGCPPSGRFCQKWGFSLRQLRIERVNLLRADVPREQWNLSRPQRNSFSRAFVVGRCRALWAKSIAARRGRISVNLKPNRRSSCENHHNALQNVTPDRDAPPSHTPEGGAWIFTRLPTAVRPPSSSPWFRWRHRLSPPKRTLLPDLLEP